MKYLYAMIVLATLGVISIVGCCKEDQPITVQYYCDAENPAEDLDWLRIKIKESEAQYDSIEVIKMEMPTFDEFGYLFQFENIVPLYNRSEYYYTCNGTQICYSLGGFAGTNCIGKWEDLVLTDTIYTSY